MPGPVAAGPQRFAVARLVARDEALHLLRGRGSLHRVWDGLLGDETSMSGLDARVRALAEERSLSHAARAAQQLELDAWLDEGCAAARSFVYVPAILTAVRRFERSEREGKPEVSLRDAYFQVATRVARARASLAGARLGALLGRASLERQSAARSGE